MSRRNASNAYIVYSVYNCTVCIVLLLCWDNKIDRDFGDVFCDCGIGVRLCFG